MRAGLNLASADLQRTDGLRGIVPDDPLSNSDVRQKVETGYHVGLLLNIGGQKFSVQPEVLYSQYGVNYKGPSSSAWVKTNAIDVPVLAKYTFGSRAIRFFVNAGPFVSYSLNGKLNITSQDFAPQEDPVRFVPARNWLAYGLAGGGGLVWHFGPGDLFVEARYNYALRSRIAQFNDANDHIKLGMVSVGYLIPMGH